METTSGRSNLEAALRRTLSNVTSASPTVIMRNNSGLHSSGYAWLETTGNWSTEPPLRQEEPDTEVWLTVRLVIVACVIIGLIFLSWGSYTLHRKCYSDKRRQKYQKAMLL